MKTGALVTLIAAWVLLLAAAVSAGDVQDHDPIRIEGNYQFTPANGVVSGSGTVEDPYVIAGWQIDAGYGDYGIRIHGTTRYFVIRDIEVSGASKAGIFLSYVENALVEECKLWGNWIGIVFNFCSLDRIDQCTVTSNTEGIHFYFSSNNQLLSTTFERNDTALYFDASNDNDLIGNRFAESQMGVYLDLGSQRNILYQNSFLSNLHNAHSVSTNVWDYRGEGNYWCDYTGLDTDADGVGDTPYVIRSDGDRDNFPLIAAP